MSGRSETLRRTVFFEAFPVVMEFMIHQNEPYCTKLPEKPDELGKMKRAQAPKLRVKSVAPNRMLSGSGSEKALY